MRLQLRPSIAGLLAITLIASCGTDGQEQIEEIFQECIEVGGGSTGDFEALLGPDGKLVSIGGEINAGEELFNRCFESAQSG